MSICCSTNCSKTELNPWQLCQASQTKKKHRPSLDTEEATGLFVFQHVLICTACMTSFNSALPWLHASDLVEFFYTQILFTCEKIKTKRQKAYKISPSSLSSDDCQLHHNPIYWCLTCIPVTLNINIFPFLPFISFHLLWLLQWTFCACFSYSLAKNNFPHSWSSFSVTGSVTPSRWRSHRMWDQTW